MSDLHWQPMAIAPRDGTPFIVCWNASPMGKPHADPVSGWEEYAEILDMGEPPARGWLHMPPLPESDVTEVQSTQRDARLLPIEWADAANMARGLCQSEANRMRTASPKTAEHWDSVATRLGALYLAADHVGVSAQRDARLAAIVQEMRAWQGKRPGYTDNDLVAILQWADQLAALLSPEDAR